MLREPLDSIHSCPGNTVFLMMHSGSMPNLSKPKSRLMSFEFSISCSGQRCIHGTNIAVIRLKGIQFECPRLEQEREMGKRAAKKKAHAKSSASGSKSVISDKDSRQQIEQSIAPRKRALKSRNTEEQAARAIEERFRGVPAEVLQSKPCKCGKLLQDKVVADLRKARQLRRRLGATYWRDLQAYFSASAPLELLKVPASDVANPRLLQGLKRAASHFIAERTAEPVLAYLAACTTINSKEVIGILKLAVAPKRLNQADKEQILIALLRCIDRLESMELHFEALSAAKDLIDETLTSMFLQAQKGRVKASTWIKAFSVISIGLTQTDTGLFLCPVSVRASEVWKPCLGLFFFFDLTLGIEGTWLRIASWECTRPLRAENGCICKNSWPFLPFFFCGLLI